MLDLLLSDQNVFKTATAKLSHRLEKNKNSLICLF